MPSGVSAEREPASRRLAFPGRIPEENLPIAHPPRGAWLHWLLTAVGFAILLLIPLGAAIGQSPVWSLDAYRLLVPFDGIFALAGYLLIAMGLPAFALWWAVHWTAPRLHARVASGALVGLAVAAMLNLCLPAIPFFGEQISVPGVPFAIAWQGEHRLAVIWATAFAANIAMFVGLGAAAGRILCAQPPAPGQFLAPFLTCLLVFTLLFVGLWSQGPGQFGWNAFLAQFDLVVGVRYERGVPFAQVGGQTLRVDLATPLRKSPNPWPAVLCVHGGGWHGGQRSQYAPTLVELARRGFVAVTADYRLAPGHRWPAQLADLQRCLAWMRRDAERLRVDPGRIGAIGWAAGGHLVCLLGMLDRDVREDAAPGAAAAAAEIGRLQAVVASSPLTDLTADYWIVVPSGAEKLLGADARTAPQLYADASAITHVSADDPPVLLLHGGEDRVVPLDQSRRLLDALRGVDVEAELQVFPEVGDRWYGGAARLADALSIRFLETHLAAGRTSASSPTAQKR